MDKSAILRSLIIGLAVVFTGYILGNAFKKRNASADSISVVGLGTTSFTSDEILFSGSYTVKAMDAKEAFAIINRDKEKVLQFFISKGFKKEEIHFSGIVFEKIYRELTVSNDGRYEKTERIFDGYEASQNISLNTRKNPELMRKIEAVADETSELINQGIEFKPNKIQYSYSDLPGLKHSLIEKGSQDACERASKIVAKGKGRLGKLKNASMGVFQITGEGSDVEDSYGGNFDLYSKQKVARITVRLEYELE